MSDLLCVNESAKAADLAEAETIGVDDASVVSESVTQSLESTECRPFECESLETIAEQIVEHANKADDHVIEAAMLIRKARKRIEAGEAGQTTWSEWAAEHLNLGESRRRELQRIADADDPKAELERIRAGNRERAAKHRAKQKEQSTGSGSQDRRYVTSVENERRDSVSERKTPSEAKPQPELYPEKEDAEPKRTTVHDQAKLVEIGESIITKAPKIASFKKVAGTPSESGVVVLLAYVGVDGSTDVKEFLTDQKVVNQALSAIGRANQTELLDADESSVSERRRGPISQAVKDGLSKYLSPNSDAA